jgi:protein O-mannosyl-transferase
MSGKKAKKIPVKVQPGKAVILSDKEGVLSPFLKWAPLAIILFTALLYGSALKNGFTSFDDDFYILKNPYLRDFSLHGIAAIFSSYYQSNYHPLTTLTYLFEFHLFGLNPLPYHLLNVLLHLLNTWLVFKCCEQLSGKRTTALIVSILFGIHPMHVESVAWIAERKDVLYSAFYLLSLFTYLQYIETSHSAKKYVLTLVLFILSLLSKSAAVTLPVLFIVIDIYKGRGINKKTLAEKIPFLLLSLVFGIINIFAQKAGGPVNILFSYYGVINGIFLFTSGIALYLIRFLVPFSLSAMHYFPYSHGTVLPVAYYFSLPFLLLICWLITRVKKNDPMRKEVLFGISFFLVAISVMLQLISVGSALTAERYTYIPYIGLFYITGQWITIIIAKKQYAKMAIGTLSIVLIVYAIQTFDRVGVWKDDEALLSDVIDKNQGILEVDYIYLLRGDARMKEHDLKGALEDYTQATITDSGFAFAGSAYYGRAHAYEASGDLKAALADYNNTIRLDPKLAEAYNGRGWVYFSLGDVKSAMQDYNMAISLKPEYAEAYNNRGWAYNNTGDPKAALQDYNKAILLDPLFEKPYYNHAAIKATSGDFNGAIADYNYLLKLHPDDNMAYYYRGLARLSLKNTTGACEDWKKAANLGNTKAEQMIQQCCH